MATEQKESLLSYPDVIERLREDTNSLCRLEYDKDSPDKGHLVFNPKQCKEEQLVESVKALADIGTFEIRNGVGIIVGDWTRQVQWRGSVKTVSDKVAEALRDYDSHIQQMFLEAFELFCQARKRGKMSDSVRLGILERVSKYHPKAVEEGLSKYIGMEDRKGKKEEYFIGICRQANKQITATAEEEVSATTVSVPVSDTPVALPPPPPPPDDFFTAPVKAEQDKQKTVREKFIELGGDLLPDDEAEALMTRIINESAYVSGSN